jgi:organic radical activating enzyme
MNSETFCVIPWAHTRINTDGTLIPCCKISPDFPKQNVNVIDDFAQDWWNGQPMRQLRQDLAQGVKTKHCNTCWNDEAAGKSSLRQEYNKRLSKHTDLRAISNSTTYVNNHMPIGLELDMGNICNFKCVMCGPEYSSKIQAERTQHSSKFKELPFLLAHPEFNFDWPNQDRFQTLFKKVAPRIKILQFKGGEPLLIKNAISTIKSVEDKPSTVISITTNGSVEFDDDFVDQLSQFQQSWLFVSVDGIEEHAEYIRYGSHWPAVHANISKLSKLDNCTFKISTVLQFYSSLTFPRIVDYALENDLYVEILFCYSPSFLNINSMLPMHHERFLKFIDEKTQQHPDVPWLKSVQGYLNSYKFDPVLHEQCKQYTTTLNNIRHNELSDIQELFHNA